LISKIDNLVFAVMPLWRAAPSPIFYFPRLGKGVSGGAVY
jgi:hypothetical protein